MTSPGASACDITIHRLIERIARRIFSAGDLESIAERCSMGLPATPQSIPEYYRLELFSNREEYHARLQKFIYAGAIKAEWDRSAGERGQLARVTMVNPYTAAELLGVHLPWKVASQAIQSLLAVVRDELPPVDHVIEKWRHGKAAGGITAENANRIIDSIRVIDAAQREGGLRKDLLLRRMSAKLFGDTKRIEGLSRQISFLLGDQDDSENEDVFARLGLVKHPQPMLISGPSSCHVITSGKLVPLVQPYLGLRPDTIDGIKLGNSPIRHVLTIENLASFNEAAQCDINPDNLLLVYVAGNPTPSLLSAYKRLIESANPSSILHWGDIDVGGFRIASRLADCANTVGYRLELFRMLAPNEHSEDMKKYGESKIQQITTICQKYGWTKELKRIEQYPIFQEQELLEWDPALIGCLQ